MSARAVLSSVFGLSGFSVATIQPPSCQSSRSPSGPLVVIQCPGDEIQRRELLLEVRLVHEAREYHAGPPDSCPDLGVCLDSPAYVLSPIALLPLGGLLVDFCQCP